MTRRAIGGRAALGFMTAAAIAAMWAGAPPSMGVGLKYVDADDFTNLLPNDGSAIDSGAGPGGGTIGNDNKWGFRALGSPHNGNAQVFEAGAGANPVPTTAVATENAAEIRQVLTGLTPGTYDFYAVFWTADGQNWTQRAGMAPGVNTLYSRLGPGTGLFANAVTASPAAGAVWDTPPEIPLSANSTRFHEGDRSMLIGKAGTATVDGSGTATVYIDDLPISAGATGTSRSFFDGVAYVPTGTAVALTASLSRSTGEIIVNNPTSTAFQIKAISIQSAASALNATNWNHITGTRDGHGNTTFDSDTWTITSPPPPTLPLYNAALTEVEDTSGNSTGGTLAAGASLNFGPIWQKSPIEDIVIQLTLPDGGPINLVPTYSGTQIAPADLDGSGSPELNDFQTLLNNMHTNITTITGIEGHQRGDINNDRLINFQDFQAFRTAYDVAHGEGAFSALVAQVPEPAALGLAVVGAVGVARASRRRRVRRLLPAALALVACCAMADRTMAVNLLSVDIDDRSEGEAGQPGNTVAGFSSYLMTGPVASPGPSMTGISTQVINGYTVSFIAFDDHLDETPGGAVNDSAGAIDDRDRGTPVDGGSLTYAQIYDDLIFAGASAGPTGGIDLTISGGTLQPNTAYSFSLYAFDSGSTPAPQPRTAVWRDGNNNNLGVISTSFQGANLPSYNEQYKHNAVVKTDATGKLSLKGRNTTPQTTGTNLGVFINAFEINTFAELTLQVNAGTGAMKIVNEQGGPLELSYYEVRSAAGSLSASGWTSIDDSENGDPLGTGWDESTNVNANLLNEVNLQNVLTLASGANQSLGAGFTAGGTQDLLFLYSTPTDLTLRAGLVKYLPGGDFNNDGDVTTADLTDPVNGFNTRFGAGGANNLTGADFLAFQRNFGFDGPPPALAAGVGVPEPAAGLLAMAALAALKGARRSVFGRRDCGQPRIGSL